MCLEGHGHTGHREPITCARSKYRGLEGTGGKRQCLYGLRRASSCSRTPLLLRGMFGFSGSVFVLRCSVALKAPTLAGALRATEQRLGLRALSVLLLGSTPARDVGQSAYDFYYKRAARLLNRLVFNSRNMTTAFGFRRIQRQPRLRRPCESKVATKKSRPSSAPFSRHPCPASKLAA